MSLSDYNTNVVLQINANYFEKIVLRAIREKGDHCLNFLGEPFVARYSDVSFTYNSETHQSFVNVGFWNMNEISADAPQPQESTVDIDLKLNVEKHPEHDDKLQLRIGNIPVEESDNEDQQAGFGKRLTLDLSSFLDQLGLSFASTEAAAIKVLSDGTIAVGIQFGPSTHRLDKFRNSYDDSKLEQQNNRDWSLVVDEETISKLIDQIDVPAPSGQVKDIDISFDRITDQHIELDVSGTFEITIDYFLGEETQSFDLCADAKVDADIRNPGTDQAKLIGNVNIDSIGPCNSFISVPFLEISVSRELVAAVYGDRTDPAGLLIVHKVEPENGELILLGEGTKSSGKAPQSEVSPASVNFTPTCDDLPQMDISLMHTKEQDDQLPLFVCPPTITGEDKDEFSVTAIGSNANSNGENRVAKLASGESVTFRIYCLGSEGQTYSANLKIPTNIGVRTVELQALFQGGNFIVPDPIKIEGKEEVIPCSDFTEKRISKRVSVENDGPGPVVICSVDIVESSGGKWWTEKLNYGDVLYSGDEQDLVLHHMAEEADQLENATLQIKTTDGVKSVALEAIVKSDNNALKPRSENGVGIGGLGPGDINFCIGPAELGKMLEISDRIDEIIKEPWEDMKPQCCPEPEQPRCLCRHGMTIVGQGLPDKVTLEIKDPHGKTILDGQTNGSRFTASIPYPKEGNGRINLQMEGESNSVQFKFRHWGIKRIDRWDSENKVNDVLAGRGQIYVQTSDGQLQLLSLKNNNQFTENTSLDLGLSEPRGLVGFQKFLIAFSQGEHRIIRINENEPRIMGSGEIGAESIYPIKMKNREEPFAYALTTEGIELLDFSDPQEPRRIAATETNLDSPSVIMALDSHTILAAGGNGVQRFELDKQDIEHLKPTGRWEGDAIHSLIGLPGNLIAFHANKPRASHLLLRKERMRQGFTIGFPDNWEKLLPGGSFTGIGSFLAAPTRDSSGVNLLQGEMGQYRPE